jgi:DNA mismatch repair ATPase MutS
MVKLKTLINIQKKVKDIYYEYGKFEFWKPFCPDINIVDLLEPLHYNSLTIYKVLTNEKLKENVKNLCKISIIHDTLVKLSDKLKNGWCISTYGDETFIGNMKNPILINNNGGVANPIRLEKHLVISGANAGGKTTYVKSLLWNILMGQSFGIVYGDYSQIKVYDGIMHHHRVKDITGDQSLFQAEMYKIKDSLDILKNYKNVIYFMDEPMHSTHPIDGSIMLKSLMYHLSLQENLKIVLTSHYFILQELETELPDKFKNLCVKAIRDKDNNIVFDFKIYKNGSHQTIGIELLEKEGFPEDIFKTATKIKNKLYPQ